MAADQPVEVKRFLVCPDCDASAVIDAMVPMLSHLRLVHKFSEAQVDQYRATPRVREFSKQEASNVARVHTETSAPVESVDRAIAELRQSVERGIASIFQGVESGELCTHPNGFGPNGCAGCGSAAPEPQDDAKWEDMATAASDLHARMRRELEEWWLTLAAEEADKVIPKAVEYSSTDLRDIGRVMAETMGREITDEEAQELGIFFYLQGKMSRWVGAVKEGRRPSDDTLHDLGVYVRMAQRVRHSGGWPGVEMPDTPAS